MVAAVVAACAPGTSYLGQSLPAPCSERDVEACLGWMVERDLAAAELGLYDDAALRDYVQGVADRLAAGSSLAQAPRVVIANREGAYATSGTRIVIGRPTLERLDSEAELAGVVAHELAHIEGHHAVVSLFGPPPDDALRRQRHDAEAIADERAVALLERAGYTPGAMARALRAVLDAEDDDHPRRADRIARVAVLAGKRAGFEGRDALLAHVDHMVVGRDPRLGYRVGDAWVVAALGLALELAADDVVREADHVLVVRRGEATIAAYAVGAPWAAELAGQLAGRRVQREALGTLSIGTVAPPPPRDDAPLARLARAIHETLPQPAPGTRAAILERANGAIVLELGGRPPAALGLRPATPAELIAATPSRVVLEYAVRTGTAGDQRVCDGRLLDAPGRRVSAGERVRCADRAASRELAIDLVAGAP
jgi:hypothetical protein